MELYPLRYVYHEDDVVYIGADKYEISDFNENAVSLRNVEFPLFGKELSRADFEEKLREKSRQRPSENGYHREAGNRQEKGNRTTHRGKARQHHILHRLLRASRLL